MAESAFPRSFRDPIYASLDERMEKKHGLPVGLVASIREDGERSNADQTNKLGTKTPYQFIPATRDAILKKYGLDVALSPENASEGAALLMKEGLKRAGGDVETAVRAYHGGLDKSQWGPVNDAYAQRVMAGVQDRSMKALSAGFGAFMAQEAKKPAPAPAQDPATDKLSAAFGAWRSGADQIPGTAVPADRLPVSGEAPAPAKREPGFLDKALGVGEAALTVATGATGGALGMAGGAVTGMAQQILSGQFGTAQAADAVEKAAAEGAQALTYMPRTESGQQYAQNVGEGMAALIPVAPMGAEIAGLTRAAGAAARPIAGSTAAAVGDAVGSRVAPVAQEVRQATQGLVNDARGLMGKAPIEQPAGPAPGTGASIGAAGTDMVTQRVTKAENLPAPIKLTQGAATRDAAQLAFEKEALKGPEGAPLRARVEENNAAILSNFERLVDSTDAQAPDIVSTGNAVTKALGDGYKAAKTETRAAYAKAEASPEALMPVDAAPIIEHLNQTPSGLKTTALTDHAKQYAIRLGVAAKNEDGSLSPLKTDVKTMEALRREINAATGFEPVEIRDATILKKLIDGQTRQVEGTLYKEARQTRERQARKYESRAIVSRLVNDKRGMDDPMVAADQVFQKSILNGAPEEITFLKRVLSTTGPDGAQAWQEIKGAMLRHIQEEASKGMGMDSADRPIVSPAKLHQTVSALDKNGRLDLVLGKQAASIVRDVNDVARYVNTVPPGTLVNNSGTAGTLAAVLAEAGATGALTGLPVPVLSAMKALSSKAASNRLKVRVQQAMNESNKRAAGDAAQNKPKKF
jgi:hypothetical protein